MTKTITTPHAPTPIGPYSQAKFAGNLLFLSGQIAIDPHTGSMVEGAIADQTHQIMKNIEGVLSAANMTFDNIVKATVFVKNIEDFDEINKVYATYFTSDHPPARSLVEVARLPKDANLEIEMIAAHQ